MKGGSDQSPKNDFSDGVEYINAQMSNFWVEEEKHLDHIYWNPTQADREETESLKSNLVEGR